MNLRIEPEGVRTNDVLSKPKRNWQRRRRKPRDDEQDNKRERRPSVDEVTVDLVA